MTLAVQLAWPIVAVSSVLSVLACLCWAFWFWRHPTFAAQRLDAAEKRHAEVTAELLELRGRVNGLESMSAPEFGTAALVAALRPAGGGR